VETRLRNATDPRDKIFSLFGLLHDYYEASLLANYNLTLTQVYVAVAAFCLLVDRDLQILAATRRPSVSQELPSWVPDWRFPVANPLWGYDPTFSAARDTRPAIAIQANSGKLHVKGLVLAKIKEVTKPLINPVNATSNIDRPSQSLGSTTAEISPLPFRDEPSPWPAEPDSGLAPAKKDLSLVLTDAIMSQNPPSSSTAQHSLHNYLVQGRHLFVSEGSNYVGLCPDSARKGDLVCIFLGGAVPFVVRPKNVSSMPDEVEYTLIGECFVNGAMHGEPLPAQCEGNFDGLVSFLL
jgi:hypothetical protein